MLRLLPFLCFLGGCLPVWQMVPPDRVIANVPWPPRVARRRRDPHHAPNRMFRRRDGEQRVGMQRRA